MTRSTVRILGVTLALLLAAAAQSQAAPVLTSWQYNSSPGSSDYYSTVGLADPGTKVHFSDEGEVQRQTEVGGIPSNITASNLTTYGSLAYPGRSFNTAFTFQVVVREGWDLATPGSLPSGALTFHGTITGNLWNPGSSLIYTISDPDQTIDVGTHRYVVHFDPTHRINGPGGNRQTSVDGEVSVQNLPEPSTAILSCVGLVGMGLVGFRRWKKGPR